MLSYQHGFHAGNMADVHKHAILAWMIDYLTQKDKPLSYMETHAGRGLYDLGGDQARKTGEAAQGIAIARDWFDATHPYARVCDAIRSSMGKDIYPGSPLIAAHLLRQTDSMTLAELHPQEYIGLRKSMARTPRSAHMVKQDGAQVALSFAPPTPRRGVMLIDPSYEIKTDYADMATLVQAVHKKWPVGVIALWYPVLNDAPHRPMIAALPQDTFVHEVRFPPARPGHRMIGSGMAIVNAPWGIADQAKWLSDCFARIAPQS